MVIDAIRNDPSWDGGEYKTQPPSLRTAAEMLWFMSSNPVLRQKDAPSLAKTDEVLDKFVEQIVKTDDANDVLYALEASHDYDPGPNLGKNSCAPSRHQFCRRPDQSTRARHSRARDQACSQRTSDRDSTTDKTRGHGSHTLAALWKDQLVQLLKETEK
jgi:Homoserine acetyltransferase